MPVPDRDQSIEQMLRRVMSDAVPPQGECLDGETIAAWSEGQLRAAEASAVEQHVAGCARCRALMASFVQTTPAQPVAESLWRRWHLGWVVPLATAATAAAIWVALPGSGARQLAPKQETNAVAQDERLESPAVPPQPTARSFQQLDQAKAAEPPVVNETRQRANDTAAASRELAGQQGATRAAAEDAAAAPAAGAPAAPSVTAPAAPRPTAVAERAEADTKKEAAANSTFAPLARAFAANPITSPDGTARWRIVSGQQVENSMDAGNSWTPATIDSPDRLNAGAAPSATVCWIVGARGAVYLTTDGTRFVRLPFTEMVDLASVFATDALSATVSSADGRSWRTTDGGRSWNRQ